MCAAFYRQFAWRMPLPPASSSPAVLVIQGAEDGLLPVRSGTRGNPEALLHFVKLLEHQWSTKHFVDRPIRLNTMKPLKRNSKRPRHTETLLNWPCTLGSTAQDAPDIRQHSYHAPDTL